MSFKIFHGPEYASRPVSPSSSVDSWAKSFISDLSHLDPSLAYHLGEYYVKFEQLPLEDWIHERFCSGYPCHAWAHDALARALLLSAFMEHSRLPTIDDIIHALVVARALRKRLGDASPLLQELLVTEALNSSWSDLEDPDELPWASKVCPFPDLSSFGRCATVIFADAMSQQYTDNPPVPCPSQALIEVMHFLTEPDRDCPTSPDILRLPGVANATPMANVPPAIDPQLCTCGKCTDIQAQWSPRGTYGLDTKYHDVVQDRKAHGCDAIARAWEPLLQAAESWLEDVMGNVETPIDLFPGSSSKTRPGPALIDILNLLDVKVGSQMTGLEVLRVLTALRMSYEKEDGAAGLLRVLEEDMLGYVSSYVTPDERSQALRPSVFWMSTTGGWLYDLPWNISNVGLPVIYFLYSSEDVHIICERFNITASAAVHMATLPGDVPLVRLPEHEGPPRPLHAGGNEETDCGPLTIHLSNIDAHAFPLFTVRSGDSTVPRSSVAARLYMEYQSRTVETLYRPYVIMGERCGHSQLYRVARRCSLSSTEILLQVRYPSRDVMSEIKRRMDTLDYELLRANPPSAALEHMLGELARRIELLRMQGGSFERGRTCIVRCGNGDGPAEPIVLLAGSLGKRVYVFRTDQCWDCAYLKMTELGCTVGIASGTKWITTCDVCEDMKSHAEAMRDQSERERPQ